MAGQWSRLKAFQIYGANTDVGKTIVSTAMCRAALQLPKTKVHYIKPVATGPANTIDVLHVKKFMPQDWNNHRCFQHLQAPLSPPLALRYENQKLDENSRIPADDSLQIVGKLEKALQSVSTGLIGSPYHGVAIVETFGGPMSPMANQIPQADSFRSLRLPVILVADTRLGGVSTTLSAYESLTIRGYDIRAIAYVKDPTHDNVSDIAAYLKKNRLIQKLPPLIALPQMPKPHVDPKQDFEQMSRYYDLLDGTERLHEKFKRIFLTEKNTEGLSTLSARATKSIWHPFMQHKQRQAKDILAIDSAFEDSFQIYDPASATLAEASETDDHVPGLPQTKTTFDGSASWWTQGLGHGRSDLALTAAYAAGRYGHVMFAGAVHEPAIELAERMLDFLNNPRLSKVFFSDDGSTGVEVAIKMALKASARRYGWTQNKDEIGIIGLQGSYHGDTIGAMDCSEPSTYNQKVEWYRGRGFWFDFPQVNMKQGKWVIEPPAGKEDKMGSPQSFDTLTEVFSLDRDPQQYEKYIDGVLDREILEKKQKFGALVLEPVLLGAGGMMFVDPLFQRALVTVVRRRQFGTVGEKVSQAKTTPDAEDLAWTGLPVVFDEVFTGLYRLGPFSAAKLLDVHPDISVHAKLLTGGILPLCLTIASDSIFDAFLGDEKSDALLHGHSYTAHAIGCHVANASLFLLRREIRRDTIMNRMLRWRHSSASPARAWSMWRPRFVQELSHAKGVDGVVSLGTVLAIKLSDPSGSGYTSNAAQGIQQKLLEGTDGHLAIHCRVLGNVLYVMTSLTTSKEQLSQLAVALANALGFNWVPRSLEFEGEEVPRIDATEKEEKAEVLE